MPSLRRVVSYACRIVAPAGLATAAACTPLLAQAVPAGTDSARIRTLDTLTVTGRYDNLIDVAATASEGRIGAVDLRLRPILREGELLETVPGMIVTQHSGDGKANQYFARGFNLDHGTDFLTRVEGMPVNMPSHAHGQGYTDLNFLIPEFVDYLEYRLGVYHADQGDFGSAGGAEFHLLRRMPRPFVSAIAGEHGLLRLVAGASTPIGTGDLLTGFEAKSHDGPWDVPQNLRKLAGLARYTWNSGASRFSVLGMVYHNVWDATDQIPERAVASGLIGQFGAVDATDGGASQRYSLSASWRRVRGASIQAGAFYAIYSDLDLYSNVAYFLEDPARGDQFNQHERRVVVGGSFAHAQAVDAGGVSHVVKVGVKTRVDLLQPVALYRTTARQRVRTVRQDRVRQWAGGVFAEAESRWTPALRSVLGVRGDVYAFDVDAGISTNAGTRTAGIVSPKGSLVLTVSPTWEVYASGGLGFHSNDARGTTITVDPTSGDPAEQVDPLVRSRGAEVGVRASPLPGWRTTAAVWLLDLDSELLFVGDAGLTEPANASRRRGVTVASFYQAAPGLSLDVDVSFSYARFRGMSIERHIPGALERVVAAGAAWQWAERGPFAAFRVRHFGSYPLIEDNSVRARSATLVNANVGWTVAPGLRVQISVLNVLDARDADIQYYYRSRLPGEPAGGLDDVHFHPVEPRQVRAGIAWGI